MIPSILGGALIGLSASLLWSLTGRVAGVSGMLGGILQGARDGRAVRFWFLAGLILTGLACALLYPFTPRTIPLGPLALAGLFVGAGTRLGSGCTSGHGVCGLSRFSKRSLVAVLTFMGTGALTVFFVRHVLKLWGSP